MQGAEADGDQRDLDEQAGGRAEGSFPNKKHGSNMSFFQGGGGPGRTKSFEALFVCPEAIKSKQMPMCQKA